MLETLQFNDFLKKRERRKGKKNKGMCGMREENFHGNKVDIT